MMIGPFTLKLTVNTGLFALAVVLREYISAPFEFERLAVDQRVGNSAAGGIQNPLKGRAGDLHPGGSGVLVLSLIHISCIRCNGGL